MKNIIVVIPTIRDVSFLESWKDQFEEVTVIVCEDRIEKQVKTPKVGKKTFHYSWADIDVELGDNSWIIPRKVSAIRSFGFLKAYEMGADIVVTLDDDCYPVEGHLLIEQHIKNLSLSVPGRWVNTYPDERFMFTRGMPYGNRKERKVCVSHGLWTNILDLDAQTHLQHLDFEAESAQHFLQIIPTGAYYPMCSMNLAFTREVLPLMYFPLMGSTPTGRTWGYDRFDDIWAGLFSKKIMDHLGLGVVNGAPFVEHRKASDVHENLKKEATGIEINEKLWGLVDEVVLTKKTIVDCYLELAEKITFPKGAYFEQLRKAMIIWGSLFES